MKGRTSVFLILFIFCSLEITSQTDDTTAIEDDTVINSDVFYRPGNLNQKEIELLTPFNQDQSFYSNLDTLKYSKKGYLMDREMLKILVQKTDSFNNYLVDYILSNIKVFGFSSIKKSFLYDIVAEKMLHGEYFYSCDAFTFYSTEYEISSYADTYFLEEINKKKRADFISHLAWLYKDKKAYLLERTKEERAGCYHDNLLIILSEMDYKGY